MGLDIFEKCFLTKILSFEQFSQIFLWQSLKRFIQGLDTSDFYHCFPLFAVVDRGKNLKCPALAKNSILFFRISNLGEHHFDTLLSQLLSSVFSLFLKKY